jgi:hypothetical protein
MFRDFRDLATELAAGGDSAPLKPLPEPVDLGQYRVRNRLAPMA